MRENRKYYFTVEGETEKWYLQWLQSTINAAPTSKFRRIAIDCPVQKDPLKRAKSLVSLEKTKITHIFDYENNDDIHTTQFLTTLTRMKNAQNLGKSINYQLGYSNFTFELWMLLHKIDCSGAISHRRQYLSFINRAYNENFENLDQYKHENNFKRVLSKLSLDDVCKAISRAKSIMQNNKNNLLILHQYKGYKYYKENPSLSIWEEIERILLDCNLL